MKAKQELDDDQIPTIFLWFLTKDDLHKLNQSHFEKYSQFFYYQMFLYQIHAVRGDKKTIKAHLEIIKDARVSKFRII